MSKVVEEKFKYCQEATINIDEPLSGTAPSAQHWISISWPKKRWNYKALHSKGFPNPIVDWQKQQNSINGKTAIRLISRKGITEDSVHIFIYPDGTHYENVPPLEIINVLQRHYLGNKDNRFLKPNLEKYQIFICTHGKHDQCCALFGQSVYQKFHEVIQDRQLPIDLWESSHIGGHRFAATGIFFPSGCVYGRMTTEDVNPILDCLLENRVYFPNYRGCYQYGSKEQATEAYAHKYELEEGYSYDFQSMETKDLSEDRFQGLIKIKPPESDESFDKQLKLDFYKQSFLGPASCSELYGSESEPRTCWVLDLESQG